MAKRLALGFASRKFVARSTTLVQRTLNFSTWLACRDIKRAGAIAIESRESLKRPTLLPSKPPNRLSAL